MPPVNPARSPIADPAPDPASSSLGDIFAEVSRDLSTLLRQEIELAKAEATTSVKRAGLGAGMFAGAWMAGNLALVFLSVALWWGLGAVMGRGWSALVVAVLWAVIAAVLAMRGRTEVRTVAGMPETVESIKKIPNALQGHEEKNS
ncbi:phage holin family protein [Antribacter sp. KLBMP9083]|uniref:Phage holin family protein n=2 Tax=Antribacter soli TaxID=2910976 RepID=A0AA41QF44_9MICO|nr:phage holin family protein [Antribacter soli]MCF4122290.1 phage holin family protein [Antribacter soli]